MNTDADTVNVVPGLLRKMNVRKVLETFHQYGPCTRAQLHRRTGVSPPTVSKLISQLVGAGLVERDDTPVVTNGRPGILFRLASHRVHVIAGVIDVHQCTVVASGLDGRIKEGSHSRFETPGSFRELMDRLVSTMGAVLDANNGDCLGIGLTIPGLINRESGEVIFSPNMHFLDGETPGEAAGEAPWGGDGVPAGRTCPLPRCADVRTGTRGDGFRGRGPEPGIRNGGGE